MIIGAKKVLISQGEFYCSAQPVTISTILGSCVAVCLFDEIARCGGMNHFVLPQATSRLDCDGRCGDLAVPRLVREMTAAGAAPSRLRAKIFGGATSPWTPRDSRFAVGVANVAMARRRLMELGVPIIAERTGGAHGVRVYFDTWSGGVRVRLVARTSLR